MNGRLRRWLLQARIDARQPAVWLALGVAALAAAMLPDAPPPGWPAPAAVATLLGAAAAVMALGDAGRLGGDVGWLAGRTVWPLVGWGAVAALRGQPALLAAGWSGAVAGGLIVALLVRRGAVVADAASAALVAAGASAAVGWWIDSAWPGWLPAGVGAAAILALGALGAAAAIPPAPVLRAGLRPLLTAAGMTGALAGMVAWLFLAADRAAFDLAASLAWFAALAVPVATLGDGVSHGAVWRRLERAAPRAAGAPRRLPPGRGRDSVLAVVGHAALLGWPPLVAAVIAGASLARAWPALGVVLALAAAAGALVAVVRLGESAGASPATLQAVAVAGACLALAGAMAGAADGPANPAFFRAFRP